jgi:hypothetical protein
MRSFLAFLLALRFFRFPSGGTLYYSAANSFNLGQRCQPFFKCMRAKHHPVSFIDPRGGKAYFLAAPAVSFPKKSAKYFLIGTFSLSEIFCVSSYTSVESRIWAAATAGKIRGAVTMGP